MVNVERISDIMIEKMITPKIMEYIIKYLQDNDNKNTYVNIFNSGIIINLSVIRKIIRTKGLNYLESKIERFIKSNF